MSATTKAKPRRLRALAFFTSTALSDARRFPHLAATRALPRPAMPLTRVQNPGAGCSGAGLRRLRFSAAQPRIVANVYDNSAICVSVTKHRTRTSGFELKELAHGHRTHLHDLETATFRHCLPHA